MKIHPRLEIALRTWAKERKETGEDVVIETEVEDRRTVVDFFSSQLIATSLVWFAFRSADRGGTEIIPADDLVSIFHGIFDSFQIVSLVNPSTGGGLTIDVSDEGSQHPILQIAGWGDCTELAKSASNIFPRVHWIKGGPKPTSYEG